MTAQIRQGSVADAGTLAAIHAVSFDDPWTADSFAVLLAQPGVMALISDAPRAGFILVRAVADEAEILTLAVVPEMRRQGLAADMIAAAVGVLGRGPTRTLFLEVAADNIAALALYRGAGFTATGRRPGYYVTGSGTIDAVIMARPVGLSEL